MPRLIPSCLLILVCLVACSRAEEAAAPTAPPQADEPTAVVVALLEAVSEGRFEETPALTDARQAALLTLAEGADANDVVVALEDEGEAVAANFWSGFAQTLDPSFDPSSLTLEEGEIITQDGHRFVDVTYTPPEGEPRTFVLRHEETWKVDLLATFGAVLAERLIPPVEGLLSSANTNAATVLRLLNDATPSLRVAASDPDLAPTSHQSLLALVERVTRTSS